MATPREIRRRIASVKNTQKITKAMEMVASVKLRKARDQILNARPYSEKLIEIATHLKGCLAGTTTPLLSQGKGKRVMLIVVGSDKGLCGAFNSNVVKKSVEFVREHTGKDVNAVVIGKKPAEMVRRKGLNVAQQHIGLMLRPVYRDIQKIAEQILQDFIAGKVDEVHVAYNYFKSAAIQKSMVERLLPVPVPDTTSRTVDYVFEPSPDESIDLLLSQYFMFQVWRAVLESFASFQGAQMAAMSGASKNAGELIGRLTLNYNKARQSAITKELLEVIAGSDALK